MQRTPGPSGRRGTRGRVSTAAAFARGCRTKPFRNRRCTLAEVGAREAEHDDIAPIGQRATEAVAVFGPHPYNGSSELVGRLCDSLAHKRARQASWTCPGSDDTGVIPAVGSHRNARRAALPEQRECEQILLRPPGSACAASSPRLLPGTPRGL